ncbi:insulinase family protein [Patescibacteria group bacterium]|nr:insulinase family protein [Patescibacteria group bacterium]MDE1945280.1 insulinase family protein [Patescibacteria group bacterium]
MWDPYAEFERHVLPNGLTVYVAEAPSKGFEIFRFIIHSGSEADPAERPGMAHFVEHLANKNAPLPTIELRDFFIDLGGRAYLGGTSWNGTSYGFTLPVDIRSCARGLELFGSMLLTARLEKGVEEERRVILEEWKEDYVVKEVTWDPISRRRQALYPGHPLHSFVCPLGTPESILAITHQELQTHYDRWYTPANMTIVALGGLAPSTLVSLVIESVFGTGKPGVRRPVPVPFDAPKPVDTGFVLRLNPHVPGFQNMRYVSAAATTIPTNPAAMEVAWELLSQELFDEIREKRQWTYDVSPVWEPLGSSVEFRVHCENANLSAEHDFDGCVTMCIERCATQTARFEKVRRRRIAAKQMIDPNHHQIVNECGESLAHYHSVRTLGDKIANLESLSMPEVQGVLERLAPERRFTVLMRP